MTRFTAADVDRAHAAWNASCGPAALAAICDLTLDEVRPHFGESFPGYTNPTMMFDALRATGRRWSWWATIGRDPRPQDWPLYGLARIQWDGPWMRPGVPIAARYKFTHWVGVSQGTGSRDQHLVDIFDINTISDGSPLEDGWGPLEWWSSEIVPRLTADIKRATGGWHVTHAIEVELR
jgi:hypothetical protein